MGFFLDAKARNGVRAVKIALLYLEQSLDGWLVRTSYEDWRGAVIKDLRGIVTRVEEGLAKLPPNPYHEDDSDDDGEQVARYEEACDELRSVMHIAWNDVAVAHGKLAILLEDNRSGEQASLVDRAYEALGVAQQVFELAGDKKTTHKTPTL
jgi:hypothetical protein